MNRLLADRRGVVAVEFALMLPLFMLLFLGSYEIYLYIRNIEICERTAFTIADLVARRRTQMKDVMDASDSLNIGVYFAAASQVAAPLPLNDNGTLIISSVFDDGDGPLVTWQRKSRSDASAHHSALGTQGSSPQLPAGLLTRANDGLIAAEVFYTYRPFLGSALYWLGAPDTVTIYRRALFRPRYGSLDRLL